jgi:hypothetical protein
MAEPEVHHSREALSGCETLRDKHQLVDEVRMRPGQASAARWQQIHELRKRVMDLWVSNNGSEEQIEIEAQQRALVELKRLVRHKQIELGLANPIRLSFAARRWRSCFSSIRAGNLESR